MEATVERPSRSPPRIFVVKNGLENRACNAASNADT